MKNIVLLLLLFTGLIHGQIINFSDPNFKAVLLSASTSNPIAEDLNQQTCQIDTNADGEIQVSEALNISVLSVANTGVANLAGIEFFTNLQSLYTSNCPLAALNLGANTNLRYLFCENNQINNFDFSLMPQLVGLSCSGNLMTQLDLSMLANLSQLETSSCPNLAFLNIKNGSTENLQLGFIGNPNLRYICADDNQLQAVNNKIIQYGYTDCHVNSYCSFLPGGDYNTIAGSVIYDLLNDGCGNDTASPYIKMTINDGSNTGSTFANDGGTYSFYTGPGLFNVAPDLENPTWFTLSPLNSSVSFPVLDNSVQTRDFCIKPNGVHNDAELIFVPTSSASPAGTATYKIVYRNKGNQTLSGEVIFGFNANLLNYFTATPAFSLAQPGMVYWNYTNLRPFETRTIDLTLLLDSSLGLNPGDVLPFSATVNPAAADETPEDNTSAHTQTIVDAAGTNQTICIEGHTITPEQANRFLHYNINFENTGTEEAVNIVVKDTIDTTKFNLSTLRLLYASHPLETKVTGNIVEFIFKNIRLQPHTGGPIGGHGNVLFKIEPHPNIIVGEEIIQDAHIYFDYNAPVTTNQERTTIALMANTQFTDDTVRIAPNPTHDWINIHAQNTIRSVELYDVLGRILETSFSGKPDSALNIAHRPNGIYFLKINTDKGSSVQKLLKE